MDIEELTATDSNKKRQAQARLENRVRIGADQQMTVIRSALETVIVDKIWYPDKIYFGHSVQPDGRSEVAAHYTQDPDRDFRIHRHAMGQMASVIDVPRTYVTRLRDGEGIWRIDLLTHVFNEHFHREKFVTASGKPIGFLRRAVGNQIRGFQSRNFGRNLATAPLIKTFVEECGRYRAAPIEAKANDVVTALKCAMPYVFEPVAGEFIAFGVSFKNSDFGAAKLTVAGTIMRISSGTITVMEGALSKIHIGKAIDTSDEMVLSDETIGKELDAVKSAVADVIRATLSAENVKTVLSNIALADQHGINWFQLSQSLSKVLGKQELEFARQLLNVGDDLMDLPPIRQVDGERTATAWWAANLIGWFANKEEDTERRQALHELAGEVLAL